MMGSFLLSAKEWAGSHLQEAFLALIPSKVLPPHLNLCSYSVGMKAVWLNI